MKEWFKKYWWVILIILTLPIAINFLLLVPVFSPIVGENTDWLSFWGSYLGAIISAGVAFIILSIQYQQNKKENNDNRDLQKNVLKHQLKTQWLADLKIKLIDYYNAFHYIDLYNICVLMRDRKETDKDFCAKKLHTCWSDKSNATKHIQMLFSLKTDKIENDFIKVLSEYDAIFNELYTDLTWYCHIMSFEYLKNITPEEYAKLETEKFRQIQNMETPNRIVNIIEKYDYKIISCNEQIINERIAILEEYNSATLWGNIKALVGYEQKLIDNILIDSKDK